MGESRDRLLLLPGDGLASPGEPLTHLPVPEVLRRRSVSAGMTKNPAGDLETPALRINEEHRERDGALREGLGHAILDGALPAHRQSPRSAARRYAKALTRRDPQRNRDRCLANEDAGAA